MEFRDLKKQYIALKPVIDEAVADVITSARFISGPQVKELEQQLADYVGVKHCISCANGTDAITIGLMAWGIGAGDAVFVPSIFYHSLNCGFQLNGIHIVSMLIHIHKNRCSTLISRALT